MQSTGQHTYRHNYFCWVLSVHNFLCFKLSRAEIGDKLFGMNKSGISVLRHSFVGGQAESTTSTWAILSSTQHNFHSECGWWVSRNSSYKSLLNILLRRRSELRARGKEYLSIFSLVPRLEARIWVKVWFYLGGNYFLLRKERKEHVNLSCSDLQHHQDIAIYVMVFCRC